MNDKKEKIQSVLTRIYQGLCAHKADLKITPHATARSIEFEIIPHELDFRKLIGKQGILYQYMRLVLKRAGEKVWITEHPIGQLRVGLEIERLGYGQEDVKVLIDPNYDRVKMMELINDACSIVFDTFEVIPQHMASKSVIEIKVADECDPILFLALNKIFWAYGKATGRLIELEFSNATATTPITRATV